jgi:hypothetical protein
MPFTGWLIERDFLHEKIFRPLLNRPANTGKIRCEIRELHRRIIRAERVDEKRAAQARSFLSTCSWCALPGGTPGIRNIGYRIGYRNFCL